MVAKPARRAAIAHTVSSKARRPRYTASDRMPLTLTHEGAPRRCSRGRSSFAPGWPAARVRAPLSYARVQALALRALTSAMKILVGAGWSKIC